jgi:hypothetical protein
MAGTPTIGHQRQVLIDLRDAGRGSCLPMRIDRIGLSGSASPTTGVDMVRPEEISAPLRVAGHRQDGCCDVAAAPAIATHVKEP